MSTGQLEAGTIVRMSTGQLEAGTIVRMSTGQLEAGTIVRMSDTKKRILCSNTVSLMTT